MEVSQEKRVENVSCVSIISLSINPPGAAQARLCQMNFRTAGEEVCLVVGVIAGQLQ